jgi:hypothetical protein
VAGIWRAFRELLERKELTLVSQKSLSIYRVNMDLINSQNPLAKGVQKQSKE